MIEQEELKNSEIEVVDVPVELKNIIETLVFASDEPISTKMIRAIVEDANKERPSNDQLAVNAEIIRKAIAELNRGYGKMGTGFRIVEIAAAFTYATLEQYATWVGRLHKEKARRRLSTTAVETLAIIAYKQPITKVEVEFIRGVNVDYIMKTLLEKNLIHITGRQNTPGRPLLYGTTDEFLMHFGLNELRDLPKPREIEELIGETEAEVDRRILAEQQQLEFKEELEEKFEGAEGVKPKEPKQPRVKMHVPQEVRDEQRELEIKNKKSQEGVELSESLGNKNKVEAENATTVQNDETTENDLTEKIVKETTIENEDLLNSDQLLHQAEDDLDHRAINSQNQPVNDEQVQAIDHEQVSPARDELENQAIDSENLPVNDDHQNRLIDLQNLRVSDEADQASDLQNLPLSENQKNRLEVLQSQPLNDRDQVSPETNELENQASDSKDHPANAELDQAIDRERISQEISEPENHQINSDHLHEESDQAHRSTESQSPDQLKGWSKWKNKVKTFFQKLFA